MPDILSVDDYMASQRQTFTHSRSGSLTTVANSTFVGRTMAGFPTVAANYTLSNSPNGAVPTQSLAGVAPIETFSGVSPIGRLTRVRYTSTVACYVRLIDRLFHIGSITPNGGTTNFTSQPSYSARLPLYGGQPNYRGLRIYAEISTVIQASACNLSATYLDYDNATSRTTPTTNIQSFAVGRVVDLGHATAGASGVARLDSIIFSTTVTGAVNLFVGRTIWGGRIAGPGMGGRDGMNETGRPQIFASSCLDLLVTTDSTSFGNPEVEFEISSL